MKVEIHSIVPMPILNAKILGGNIELYSIYQSSRVLKMHSKDLHKTEDKAIGRKKLLVFGLGIGITL
jgi:hypothetical protein